METREGADYQKYSRLRNQVKWLCRKAVRDHEREIARGAKTNTKAVFSYAKKRMKTKSGVADLTRTDGSTATKSAEKAEVLNDFLVLCSLVRISPVYHKPLKGHTKNHSWI